MKLSFADTLLFKQKYRLAQQYRLEQRWLETFTSAIKQQADFDDAVFQACEECEIF